MPLPCALLGRNASARACTNWTMTFVTFAGAIRKDRRQRKRTASAPCCCAPGSGSALACAASAINLNADNIRMLVNAWHAEQLSAATMRNRLLYLRWLARKIGKPHIVAPSNRAYGAGRSEK